MVPSKEYCIAGLCNMPNEVKEEVSREEFLEYIKNREYIKECNGMSWSTLTNKIMDRMRNDYERYRLYMYLEDNITDRSIKLVLKNEMVERDWDWEKVINRKNKDAARRAGAEDTKLAMDVKEFKFRAPESMLKLLWPQRATEKSSQQIILEQDTMTIGMIDILMRKLGIKGNFIRKAAWKIDGKRIVNKMNQIGVDTSGWTEMDIKRFIRLGRDAFAELCLTQHKDIIIEQHKVGNRGYCNKPWERILGFHPTLRVLNEDEKNELLQFDREGVLSERTVDDEY